MLLDGKLVLAPTVPDEYWASGFGQTLAWCDRSLAYRMQRKNITGRYQGSRSQRVAVRLPADRQPRAVRVEVNGRRIASVHQNGMTEFTVPSTPRSSPCLFEIRWL